MHVPPEPDKAYCHKQKLAIRVRSKNRRFPVTNFCELYDAADVPPQTKNAESNGLVRDWLQTAARATDTVGRTAAGIMIDKAVDLVASRVTDKLGVDADKVKPVLDVLKVALKELRNLKSVNVTDDNGKPRVEIERTGPSEVGVGPARFRLAEKIAFTVSPATNGVTFGKIEGVGTPVANRTIGLKEATVALKDGKVEVTAKSNLAFVPAVKVSVDPIVAVKKAISLVR